MSPSAFDYGVVAILVGGPLLLTAVSWVMDRRGRG